MTGTQLRLSRQYLLYRFFSSMWFTGAVWLYFYRLFMTDYQIGMLDAMVFAIGLLAEVPSGALADKFGRARMVKIGLLLAGSGMMMQALGGFGFIFIGQAVMMIGMALVSGADEALFFKKLNFKRTSTMWRKLVTRGSQVSLVAALIATVVGGWLHVMNPHMPWILTGMACFIAAIIIWTVKEARPPRLPQKLLTEVKEYLVDIKTGFNEFRMPKLWLYVPVIIIIQGLLYTTSWGLLRLVLLDRFTFDPFWGSIAVASSSLITVGILGIMHRYADDLSEKHVIGIIALSTAASLLLSTANIGVWGYVVILTLYASEHILKPFMSEVLNNRAPEKRRATVLSVASFLRTLPYVALAPVIGYLSTGHLLEYFLSTSALLVVIAAGVYLIVKKRDARISLTE